MLGFLITHKRAIAVPCGLQCFNPLTLLILAAVLSPSVLILLALKNFVQWEDQSLLYINVFQPLAQSREKNEMGVACGMYGGGERCVQGFGGET